MLNKLNKVTSLCARPNPRNVVYAALPNVEMQKLMMDIRLSIPRLETINQHNHEDDENGT